MKKEIVNNFQDITYQSPDIQIHQVYVSSILCDSKSDVTAPDEFEGEELE